MEMTYYVCLNRDCDKYRNIFLEGSEEHAGCKRERLHLEGEERSPQWMMWAVPAALVLMAGAAFMAVRMMRQMNAPESDASKLRDRQMQTWSGTHSHIDERRGHAVPPPIS